MEELANENVETEDMRRHIEGRSASAGKFDAGEVEEGEGFLAAVSR